jgi:hypothetical protein
MGRSFNGSLNGGQVFLDLLQLSYVHIFKVMFNPILLHQDLAAADFLGMVKLDGNGSEVLEAKDLKRYLGDDILVVDMYKSLTLQ